MTPQELKTKLMEEFNEQNGIISQDAFLSALSQMEDAAREEIVLHIENEIHDDEDNPDIAIINVKAYLESLKKEKV